MDNQPIEKQDNEVVKGTGEEGEGDNEIVCDELTQEEEINLHEFLLKVQKACA